MSFAQLEYLPFLFAAVALFQFAPARGRTLFLLSASYLFYASWSATHLGLLVLSTAVDFAAGLALGAAASQGRRRAVLWTSVGVNLTLLVAFKYSRMLADTARIAATPLGFDVPTWDGFVLPLGISFYTFQTLSYTIDVYRRRIEPCRNPIDYALYVAFFPQLVAGPIERATHLLPQLRATVPLNLSNLSLGSRLILWGLVKKLVVADRLRPHLLPSLMRPEEHAPLQLLFGGVALLALLYLDFSAYTDIARGSARLFGVQLVRNFDRNFAVYEMSTFWQRWHMSLGQWLADYVHAPLSRARLSHALLWRNNLITMGLFGLWHGASYKFLALGLTLGVILSIKHSLRLSRRRRRQPRGPLAKFGAWSFTMTLAGLLFVFFFAPDLDTTLRYYRAIVPFERPGVDLGALPAPGLVLRLGGLLAVHLAAAHADLGHQWTRVGVAGRTARFAGLTYTLLRWGVAQPAEFVYFQF